MSSAGRAANSNGCVSKPKEHATGLIGFAAQIRRFSLIGTCAMETAEHLEPGESRGSRPDLGEPGGETPPGDSTQNGRCPHSQSYEYTPRFGSLANEEQRRCALLRRLFRRFVFLLGALLDRLFKTRQIVGGIDQRHVRKGLREIADLTFEMRVVFLAQ